MAIDFSKETLVKFLRTTVAVAALAALFGPPAHAARAYIGTGTVVIAQLGRAHLHYDAGQVGV